MNQNLGSWLLWVGFGLGLLLLGTGLQAETWQYGSPEQVKRGEKLYQTYCHTCHGKNGEGEPTIPIGIARLDWISAPALDESAHAWHHTDENLVEVILKGSPRTPRMQPWAQLLSVAQAQDLVAYIKHWWGKKILECQGPRHMACMQ